MHFRYLAAVDFSYVKTFIVDVVANTFTIDEKRQVCKRLELRCAMPHVCGLNSW